MTRSVSALTDSATPRTDDAADAADDRAAPVEVGLSTGTPDVLRTAAKDVRREQERLAAAAARRSTPEHWVTEPDADA